MERRGLGVLVFVFGGFFLLFLIFLGMAYVAVRGEGRTHKGAPSGPKIGIVELKGVIGAGSSDDDEGVRGLREAEQIRDFAQDDEIKAIVVRIDSPGGAVGASQEIWAQVKKAREQKKVVCSQGDLAASGGYYISVACDEIVSNPGTLTGSIGVISTFMDARELAAWAKVQPHTVATGKFKAAGSPLREFTADDRAYFETLLGEVYEQFVAAVAEGRKKKVEEIKPLADGRVFTGAKAKELGLVDSLGNFRSAVDRAMELAGLEGEPQLVYPEKELKFNLKALLRGEARDVGRALATGAAEGVGRSVAGAAQGGILFLAPGLGR